MRPCPACSKPLPFRREWASNQHRLIVGTLCPHCGARLGRDIPMGRALLIGFLGGVAILFGVDHFMLPDPAEVAMLFAWMACVMAWYANRPFVVLPEDYDPYRL